MSVQRTRPLTARTELTVLVARDDSGDLRDGVRRRLDRVGAVETVDDLDVRGLRPGLNDLAVELAATLTVRGDAIGAAGAAEEPVDPDAPDVPDAVAAALEDGFGVAAAAVTAVSPAEPDA